MASETVTRNVGILLFQGVELLDFAGPFEVFSAARPSPGSEERLMNCFTVAETEGPVRCNNPVTILPDFELQNCPSIDVLVIPGGMGTRTAVQREELIQWIVSRSTKAEVTASVCTGSFLLAQASLLDGLEATTHWASIERMRAAYPSVEVRESVRWVEEWPIITSAGVSAGIDMALRVVSRFYGDEAAAVTARHIEYEYWSSKDKRQWKRN